MDSLKIGVIAKSIDPRDGGLERHILELTNSLVEQGHDVTVFVREGHSFEDAEAELVEVPFRNIGQDVLNTYSSYLGFYRELKKREDEFDIIHGHALEPFPYILGKKLGRFDTPFVYTLHGVGSQHISRKWLKPAAKLLHRPEKSNIMNADGLIAVSSSTKNEAMEYYGLGEDDIEVINNGVDLDKFRGDWEFNDRILFVGHLISRKGPQLLLEAFEQLDTDRELELVFVGSGRMKQELVEKAEREGLEDSVVFKQDISEEELIQLYRESIFCMPSEYEGFGMVYIEAMACGAPAVATKGTAIEEVIEDRENGILTERDPGQIASNLESVINDGDFRQKLSRKGRETAEEFDWSKIADKTSEYYAKVLGWK